MNPKGVYFGIASNLMGNALMLGATLLLTRLLSPAQFGEFRVGANFAVLMVPFLALGGERYVSRLIQNKGARSLSVKYALASIFIVAGSGCILLACAFPLISDLIFDGNLGGWMYYSSIAIIPLTILYNLSNTIWRHQGDPASAQIDLNFTQRLVRAPLLIGSTWLWPGALTASFAMLLSQVISLTRVRKFFITFSWREIESVQRLGCSIREIFLIGMPVAILAAVDRLDVLLINAVMGVEDAGSYDLIYMLALTAMFPAMALSKSSEPFLYGLVGDIPKQARLRKMQLHTFSISCLAFAGICLVAPVLASILGNAGPEFSSAAIVLSAGLAFSSAHGPVVEYLQLNGKTKLTLAAVAIAMLFFLVIKYWAASRGSLTAVAAAAGLFYYVLRLFLSVYVYVTDGVRMSHSVMVVTSLLGYTGVIAYFWG